MSSLGVQLRRHGSYTLRASCSSRQRMRPGQDGLHETSRPRTDQYRRRPLCANSCAPQSADLVQHHQYRSCVADVEAMSLANHTDTVSYSARPAPEYTRASCDLQRTCRPESCAVLGKARHASEGMKVWHLSSLQSVNETIICLNRAVLLCMLCNSCGPSTNFRATLAGTCFKGHM